MLPTRDYKAEKKILTALSINNLNYAVLQPDWEKETHGDIDIVLDSNDWLSFISTLKNLISDNNFKLVKAYEIEYGVICIVILTTSGTVFLDVALTKYRKKIFKLKLYGVLESKDYADHIPVISTKDHKVYKTSKKSFKHSAFKKILKKINNLPIIIRRVIECTIIIRGSIIYIPYIIDTSILKSPSVMDHVSRYLLNTLSNRYK